MLINSGTVTSQEANLPVLLIGRRIVAISIPRTNRENNTILLDCVSHYNRARTSFYFKLMFTANIVEVVRY